MIVRRVFVEMTDSSMPHLSYDLEEDEFFEASDLGKLLGKYDEEEDAEG